VLRIAAPLAVVARVNMGDAHDVRGGSNGAHREPLTTSPGNSRWVRPV
jgi:hypothetical protein